MLFLSIKIFIIFLKKNNYLKSKFITFYNLRKFFSYKFTLDRISLEYKNIFLETFYSEINDAILRKEIDSNLFISKEIEWIKENLNIDIEKNTPLFSIIIPVYNSEDTIANTLNSLMRQTLRNFEIICINDGSIDDTAKIIDNFSFIDSRIKILNQENLGAGNARNRGLSIATGKYLLFADSDDYFEENCLQRFFDYCEDSELDLCICTLKLKSAKTKKVFDCTYGIRGDVLKIDIPFKYSDIHYDKFRSIMGWAVDKVFNLKFIKDNNIKFKDTRIHNDLNFVFTSFIKANRIGVIDEKLICKLVFNKNKLTNQKHKYFRAIKDVLLELKQTIIENNAMNVLYRDFISYAFHIIAIYDIELNGTYCYENFKSFVKDELLPHITREKVDCSYFGDKKDYEIVSKFILK